MGMFDPDDPYLLGSESCKECKAIKDKYDAYIGRMKGAYSSAIHKAFADINGTIRDYRRIVTNLHYSGKGHLANEFNDKISGLVEAQIILSRALDRYEIGSL